MKTECFSCDGKGAVGPVHVNEGIDPRTGMCRTHISNRMLCDTCNGTGSVSEEQQRSRALGHMLRAWRRENDLLMGDMADAIGVRPSELSGCELGRTVWPTALMECVLAYVLERSA